MVSFVFMSHMKNEIIKALSSLISDIEEASPNTKSKLQEIYPISFSINLKGHKTIYISLDKNVKDFELGNSYPNPIVNHESARKAALEAFQKIKKISI